MWPFHTHRFEVNHTVVVVDSNVSHRYIPQYTTRRIWTCTNGCMGECESPDIHTEGSYARKVEPVGEEVQQVVEEQVQWLAECACGETMPAGDVFSRHRPLKEAVHG